MNIRAIALLNLTRLTVQLLYAYSVCIFEAKESKVEGYCPLTTPQTNGRKNRGAQQ